MLFGFIVVLIAIVSILLIGIVLLQSGKGGGLAGIASGGTTQILGARQAPDVLEKSTWVLAGIFAALCLLTTFVIDTGDDRRPVVQGAQAGAPAATAPAAPGAAAPGAATPGAVTNGTPAAPAPAAPNPATPQIPEPRQ